MARRRIISVFATARFVERRALARATRGEGCGALDRSPLARSCGRIGGVRCVALPSCLRVAVLEGTELFVISARLPVIESFGFSAELLEWTSGAATAPQLSFARWDLMDFDPFWVPATEDELEDFGEVRGVSRATSEGGGCSRKTGVQS